MKKLSPVPETEMAILEVLWEDGSANVRQITEKMYAENTPSKHATVKSLLDRLADKGYVECDASGFSHVFSPTVDRATFVGMQVQRIADSHFGGSMAPMLLTLVDNVKLSRRHRKAIKEILENVD